MHRDMLLLTIAKSIENNIMHCTEYALIIWYGMCLCVSAMQAILVSAYAYTIVN